MLMKKNRIEGLTDGIFAIAMTLLVLTIELPGNITAESSMEAYISSLAPQLFTYALSFILLGVFWRVNHIHLEKVKGADTGFLWINLIWLMFVALVPFSTELMGNSTGLAASNMFFHVNMFIIGVLLTLNWFYSYHRGLLSVERKFYRDPLIKNLLLPAAALLAMVVTPFFPDQSSLCYLIIILKRFL